MNYRPEEKAIDEQIADFKSAFEEKYLKLSGNDQASNKYYEKEIFEKKINFDCIDFNEQLINLDCFLKDYSCNQKEIAKIAFLALKGFEDLSAEKNSNLQRKYIKK